MKRLLNYLMLSVLIATGSATFTSCDNDDDYNSPPASIELKAKEAHKDAVSFLIVTTDASEIAYQVIKGKINDLPASDALMRSGKILPAEGVNACTEEHLEANTLYSVIATAKNASNIYTEVTRIEMTTLPLCSFSIEVTETLPSTIKADITCSDPETRFIALAYPTADLEGMDDDRTNEYIMTDLKNRNGDKPLDEILERLYRTDLARSTFSDLTPDTDYTIAAYVVDKDGVRKTPITRASARTSTVKKSDITFDVTTDYTHDFGTIIVKPSVLDEKFVCIFAPKSDAPQGSSTADELAKAFVEEHREQLDRGKEMVTGIQTIESSLTPETGYYVLAFAYEYGITSEIKLVEFTTPERPRGPEDLTFETELLSFDREHFTVRVKPDTDKYYYAVSAISENSTKTQEENIQFEKEQVLARLRRFPIEEVGLMGEQEYTHAYRYEGDTSFSIIVFGIWQDGAGQYHATEMTHVMKNAFVAPAYFIAEVGEPRVITVPDGPIHTKSLFEVDITVDPAKDYYTYYIEAIPTAGYTAENLPEKIQERKDAFYAYCNDPANLLEGERNAKDIVKRLTHTGAATVTISEAQGVTDPKTEYTVLIYKVGSWGASDAISPTTVIEKAFTTPILPK